MGVYDYLPKGSQVKLWDCMMTTREVGDAVGDFGLPKYVILLREGGYVLVEKGIITKIVENHGRKFYLPQDFPNITCFDKWGNEVQDASDLRGLFPSSLLPFKDTYYPKKKATDSCNATQEKIYEGKE